MLSTNTYAAPSAGAPRTPFQIERREPRPYDVLIDILYCGICLQFRNPARPSAVARSGHS